MQFVYLPVFVKRLKLLSKKHPSVKTDFEKLLKLLEQDPFLGAPLGKNCYKIRMAISTKKRGKSGGARIITCVKVERDIIYFLTVYDKADQSSVTDSELEMFIRYINDQ